MSRRAYAETYGATVGDRLRLADTELFIEVERDYICPQQIEVAIATTVTERSP